jgi:hypothetical protein
MSALSTALLLVFAAGSAAAETDIAARVDASRKVAASFASTLKAELETALAASGPIGSIAICNVAAPRIAKEQSEAHGWHVGRTSLKTRNPANAADPWEQEVLQRFDARRAAGEDPTGIEEWAVVNAGSERVFRYMKAIPTATPCLACHGETIAPELATTIGALYPQDTAVGYRLGQIRGAFSIIQPM